MNGPIQVVYIAGWGRSGSTLLGNILGQLDGFFPAGELADVWKTGFIENSLCGCGSRFHECGIWKKVVQTAFGGFGSIDPVRMNRLFLKETRTATIPGMVFPRADPSGGETRREYLERLSSLYHAVASVTGSRVIVDSSKIPSYAAVLESIPGITLHLVHLIRDPKAVAYSWSIPKPKSGRTMRTMNAVRSSLLWIAWNEGAGLLGRRLPGRHLRIRYEDFALHPQESIRRILALIHKDARDLPFPSDHTVRLNPTHTMKGNPSRFVTGEVEILPDERWKKGMHPFQKIVVDVLTWPFLGKYGYRL